MIQSRIHANLFKSGHHASLKSDSIGKTKKTRAAAFEIKSETPESKHAAAVLFRLQTAYLVTVGTNKPVQEHDFQGRAQTMAAEHAPRMTMP
jgi:hypothetical protein